MYRFIFFEIEFISFSNGLEIEIIDDKCFTRDILSYEFNSKDLIYPKYNFLFCSNTYICKKAYEKFNFYFFN